MDTYYRRVRRQKTIAAQTDIWTYTVFLASLLQGIGKLALDRTVNLFDAQYRSLGCWEPWVGAMGPPALWYQTSFTRKGETRIADQLAPLLVQHIVPAAGLRWLWSSLQPLACWTAATSGDARSAGILGEIIGLSGGERVRDTSAQPLRSSAVPADHKTTAEHLKPPPMESKRDTEAFELVVTDDNSQTSVTSDGQIPEEPDDLGRKFFSWLQEQVRHQGIVVNGIGAHVHRVSKGLLLMSPEIFQEYDELNWQQVQKRFLKLKLHRKSERSNNFVTYSTSENPRPVFKGVLIANPRTVFGDRPLPPITPDLIEN